MFLFYYEFLNMQKYEEDIHQKDWSESEKMEKMRQCKVIARKKEQDPMAYLFLFMPLCLNIDKNVIRYRPTILYKAHPGAHRGCFKENP